MAIPQMQLTIDELKKLTEEIGKTDKSLVGVMSQLVEQTKMVEQARSSFDSSLAKVASRTLGDYKAQKKQLDIISSSNEAFRLKELGILKKISELQEADAEANADQIREQKQFLENLQSQYKKLFDLEKKSYEDISKQNLKIIKDFEDGISNIDKTLDEALTGKDVFKKISHIGEEFKETLDTAIQGNIEGMEKLLKSSLGAITTVFQMKALKLAEQGEKDLVRIKELKDRGAVSGGDSDDDIELTSLETKRISSEKDATGMLAMSKGMQMLSIGVMGVVTAFKMMIDAESKVKEFNKEMLDDAGGSLSFIRSGQESLAESLNTYREGFASMSDTIGMKASEIKTNFTSLQDTTFFNKERLKDFDGFERSFKTLSTYSKGLGLSISDTAEMAESFAHSLAIDVSTEKGMQSLSGAFQDIGFYASKSNLSTKAFATQLKEVNSKSSTFNKSIAQTSSIVLKLNKTLGATTAKEFLESITDFKEKTQEDLIKTIAMAGGPQAKQMQKIAESNAKTFTNQLKTTFASGKEKEALESAIAKSGLKLDFSLPADKLMEQFKGIDLGGDQYFKLIGELQRTGENLGMENIPELIQKLEASIKTTKAVGASSYEDFMTGLKEAGLGATLAVQFEQLSSLVELKAGKGAVLGKISDPIMLNALKEQSGLDDKNFQTLHRLSQQSIIDFNRAQEIQKSYASADSESRKKMEEELSKMGSKIELGADGTYELLTKNTDTQILTPKDMAIATSEIFGEQEKTKASQVKSEQELMKDQVDATWGIGDRLEATFGVYLEQLNSYVARILSYISSWFGSQSDEEMKTQQRLKEEKIAEQERADRQIKAEKEKIAGIKRKGSSATKEELEALKKSEESVKFLMAEKERSQVQLDMISKGIELKGEGDLQRIQLATSSKEIAEKEFGVGSVGAKIGTLKESLKVKSESEFGDLLDEMRDIFEQSQEGDASSSQLKKLEDFKQKVKASGLQLQMEETTMGTEYLKILDQKGKELFSTVEGTFEDTFKDTGKSLLLQMESVKPKQAKAHEFFKELGATDQQSALEKMRRIPVLENMMWRNKEEEEEYSKIIATMNKYGVKSSREGQFTNITMDDLTLGKSDYNLNYATEFTKSFNPAEFAKAQTEENKRNELDTIRTTAEGVKQGNELSKTTTLPTPMNDFIWREKGGLQSFSPQDNVIGFKDQGKMGSAINNMMAGNTTNTNNARAMFNININGGNKDEVLKVITDALKRAGVVTERTSYA